MSFASSMKAFGRELRRRRVVRVAVVYAVVGYTLVQIAVTVAPLLQLPAWTPTFVVLMALIGFPLALILAWAYELSPEGVRRTDPNPPDAAASAGGGRSPGVVATRQPPARRPSRRREKAGTPPTSDAPTEAPSPTPDDLRRAMLATFRHELRTPLNAVIGYSELLMEDLPPERSGPLKAILTAGQKALLQINDILRPDAEKTELTDETLARMRRRLREEMTEPAERLVDLCAQAAAELEDAGPATMEDVERLAEAARRLRELVRSELTGPAVGMDEAAAGLTRELATRVIAGLPRGGASAEDVPPKHGQILVVDDNESNRDLLSRQLARQGFSVSLAADGEDALRLLRRQDYDLVLLDVLMPGLDGIGVLTRMQRDPATSEVPVIMTSAMDELEGVVRCIEQGAVDYLIKPFDPVLLQARVATTLDLHRLRAQQRRAQQELEEEIAWSERLARSLVPDPLAKRVRDGRGTLVQSHDGVTVLVAVVQGLSTFATRRGEGALAEWLVETVSRFEACARDLPVEVHWEAGSTLVAIGGSDEAQEREAGAIAELGLRLRAEGAARAAEAEAVRVGIGIHSGGAVTALVEADRLAFGLWGEAPEVARELAAHCETGAVQVSPAAYASLHGTFGFEPRGIFETSSGTQMRVYGLLERLGAGR